MDNSNVALPAAGAGGPSTLPGTSETATPATHDDDSRHAHFAISASSAPKHAGSLSPTLSGPGVAPEGSVRDAKSFGTRFHEECNENDAQSPRLRSSRLYKGKGKEKISVERETKKPLCLLDLPVDILKDIVKEVTHTNDLTSLALCHSALHRLATPHIYSRFDIVWPDSSTHAEPRSGVDALTYGLATLVMAEEIFGEAPGQRTEHSNRFNIGGRGRASEMTIRRRKGNHYAQFTRKFSLGNGPSDWVQEYLITKEGGKMLGTLVALAIARMRALETFIWDMPTGILRDVWLALSSLGDRHDGRPCRLEKVWVRWHNNTSDEATTAQPQAPLPVITNNAPASVQPQDHLLDRSSQSPPRIQPGALDRVEHPSFSALPPLKSISVLDIDELVYLDEMAVLIGKSLNKLRELRVGIARHAVPRDWVTVLEGDGLRQVDLRHTTLGSWTIGERRLGGVLGTLTGLVNDTRKPKLTDEERERRRSSLRSRTSLQLSTPPRTSDVGSQPERQMSPERSNRIDEIASLHDVLPDIPNSDLSPVATTSQSNAMLFENDPLIATGSHASSPLTSSPVQTPGFSAVTPGVNTVSEGAIDTDVPDLDSIDDQEPSLDNVLQLENLELERTPLSVAVLHRAIDWTQLTSLTLLHCPNHEQLWKTLRRSFAPTPRSHPLPRSRRASASTPKRNGKSTHAGSGIELEYALKLKKIHTNNVSPALISFLKDTLAPNSLEVLFLQDARSHSPSVSVNSIYKGPLRRHRSSLKKILIDSSEKGPDGQPTNSARWRRWILSREILSFMCSGKMPALRELGMVVDYRDWHFFLQHLPSISHLRSLYIPFLADHVHENVDPRELALQVVDIVTLRPDVELCYMGIANKCFEILENRRDIDGGRGSNAHLGFSGAGGGLDDGGGGGSEDEHDDEDEEDQELDDVGDEEDGAAVAATAASASATIVGAASAVDDTESDDEAGQDDDDDEDYMDEDLAASGSAGGPRSKSAARLRLREILFYDDKVAIFKARHGRL